MSRDDRPTGRRDFLKAGLAGAAGSIVLFRISSPLAAAGAAYRPDDHRWGYAVDLTKCIGCGACVRACKAENDVPDGYHRTWVERYTYLDDGRVLVDSPNGALDGFPSDPDVGKSRIVKSYFVPKLCNHCTSSPCVQVCPVGASYESRDGVVLVDKKHCIGCGYCVQACPYGCRYVDHRRGYADKCTFCYHRITKGLLPACVQACPVEARIFGDLADPGSKLSRLLRTTRSGVLKPELGTHPTCHYIGLDQEVR